MNDIDVQPTHDPNDRVSLTALLSLFYQDTSQLGTFRRVASELMPEIHRGLLAHNEHMTVTVEAYHKDSVEVVVLQSTTTPEVYSREILLKTHAAHKVVQYGIVRLHLRYLADRPKFEILQEHKPLGRVLIEHQVLREVELFDLWEVSCGPSLAEFFGVPVGTKTFGRTAMIHCDNEPAIELLEIVSP